MSRQWIHESPPQWDADKESILGGTSSAAFDLRLRRGQVLPGDWWRVEDAGRVVGYGWMDCTWGDAEILLGVHGDFRRRGVGAYILDQLEREAAVRGVNYLYNQVRPTHPDREGVTAWLERHGFEASGGDNLLRRRVRPHA